MRRHISSAIAIIMLLTINLATQVFAADNPGFTTVGLVITYDPSVLQITGVTAPVSAMPLNPQFALSTSPGTQWIPLVNTNLVDWGGNGTIANITFNVSSTATLGTNSISLAFTSSPDGTPGNANGDVLRNATVLSGSVNITAPPVVQPPPQPPITPPPSNGGNGSGDSGNGTGGTQQPGNNANNRPNNNDAVEEDEDDNAILIEEVDDTPPITELPVYVPVEVQELPVPTPQPFVEETFIGTPYTPYTATYAPSVPEFGNVPQTGVSGIIRVVLIASGLLATSIVLWSYVFFRHKRRGVKNG